MPQIEKNERGDYQYKRDSHGECFKNKRSSGFGRDDFFEPQDKKCRKKNKRKVVKLKGDGRESTSQKGMQITFSLGRSMPEVQC